MIAKQRHSGTVIAGNQRGRVVVRTDWGLTVADITDGSLDRGETVTGDLDSHGAEIWHGSTNGRVEVHVEAIQATEDAARRLLTE